MKKQKLKIKTKLLMLDIEQLKIEAKFKDDLIKKLKHKLLLSKILVSVEKAQTEYFIELIGKLN